MKVCLQVSFNSRVDCVSRVPSNTSSLIPALLSSLPPSLPPPSPLVCRVTHSLGGAGWFDLNHIRRFVLGNILNRVGLVKCRMLCSLPHFWGHTRVAQQILKCSCAHVCVQMRVHAHSCTMKK